MRRTQHWNSGRFLGQRHEIQTVLELRAGPLPGATRAVGGSQNAKFKLDGDLRVPLFLWGTVEGQGICPRARRGGPGALQGHGHRDSTGNPPVLGKDSPRDQ